MVREENGFDFHHCWWFSAEKLSPTSYLHWGGLRGQRMQNYHTLFATIMEVKQIGPLDDHCPLQTWWFSTSCILVESECIFYPRSG